MSQGYVRVRVALGNSIGFIEAYRYTIVYNKSIVNAQSDAFKYIELLGLR